MTVTAMLMSLLHSTAICQTTGMAMHELVGGSLKPCCAKCEAMTGTQEGLRSLLSDAGYQHSSWRDFQESASRGCPLCIEISSWNSGRYTEDPQGRQLHLVADRPSWRPPGEPVADAGPLQGLELHSIRLRTEDRWLSGDDLDDQAFHLVTFESK